MWLQPTPVDFLGLTLVQWPCFAAALGFGHQPVLSRMGRSRVCHMLSRLRREGVVA